MIPRSIPLISCVPPRPEVRSQPAHGSVVGRMTVQVVDKLLLDQHAHRDTGPTVNAPNGRARALTIPPIRRGHMVFRSSLVNPQPCRLDHQRIASPSTFAIDSMIFRRPATTPISSDVIIGRSGPCPTPSSHGATPQTPGL